MAQCSYEFDAHYRWEWFRREQWRKSFRETKRHSTGAFVELMRDRGMKGQPVLDCSCGLGLKTIVLREAGLSVAGSDGCAEAARLARLFAAEEGHTDLRFFASTWAQLPCNTDTRYAAIYNDALSWTGSDKEMAASLKGLHDCLLPGGILTYMGALPGTSVDQNEFLEQEWVRKTANGRHWLGPEAAIGDTSVQELVFLAKGEDCIEEHHLYLVHDSAGRRIESWCLRCSVRWGWEIMEPLLRDAGFVFLGTTEFIAPNGKAFHLVVAARD